MPDENVTPEPDHIIEFETEQGTLESPGDEAPEVDPLEARLAEIRAEYGDDAESSGDEENTDQPATEEVAAKTEEETEAEPDADAEAKETGGQQLRKLLAKEKQIREDRKQFETDSKEHAEKLAEYEQAKGLASIDPIAFLKTLGLEQEQLEEVAKGIYYDALGDDAPDEYKGERQLQALKQEIAKLKQDVAGGQAKKQELAEQAKGQAALDEYIGGLQSSIGELDADASPNVGKILEAYGDQTVLADMVAVADAYGRENPTEAPLTAEEAFSYLEDEYGKHLAKLAPTQAAAQGTQAAPKKPKTLRNNISSKQPAEEAPDPDKDWEAYKEYCRNRGMTGINAIYKKSGY